jgi:hypothetical protein
MFYSEEQINHFKEAGRKGGKKSRSYKLTKHDIEEAHKYKSQGKTYKEIAAIFNMSASGMRYAMLMKNRQYPETLH